MSHSLVFSIDQDDRGFLWFGTRDGLNRYDGFGFEIYRHDPDDPESLADNSVSKVLVDRHGEPWLGTDGGGLNHFVVAEERFVHYRHDSGDPKSLSHDIVWALLEDRRGRLWVGTEDGLNRLHDDRSGFTRYQHDEDNPTSLPGRRVMAVAEGPEGGIWVGIEGGGLSRLDTGSGRFRHHELPAALRDTGSGTVLALAFDPQGGLWVGSDHGLGRFDPTERSWHVLDDGTETGVVFSLLIDGGGLIWVGSYTHGLGRYDPTTDRLTMFRPVFGDAESLASQTVFTLFEDRAGTLWIGTRLGVDQYPRIREQFAVYRHRSDPTGSGAHTPSGNLVRGLVEDRTGRIWVGTDGGLSVLDREEQALVPFEPLGSDVSPELWRQAISTIYEDRRGHLWVGFWFGGAAELDAARRHTVTHHHDPTDTSSLCGEQVRAIHQDRSGRLWIGTYNGLCYFDATRDVFVHAPDSPTDPQALGYGSFWSLLEQRGGTMWFGSLDGLFRRDAESGQYEVFRHSLSDRRSLANNKVLALYEDSRGVVWVGTQGGGVQRFEDASRTFSGYRQRDGLAHDSVEAILEDAAGFLWFSTSGGLSRFDPATETFQNYSADDGLQGNIFSYSSALRSSTGELLFGGLDGLTGFFADRLAAPSSPPPIVLTRLYLFNEPAKLRRLDPASPLERSLLTTSELVLSHREYVFTLEFAALEFVAGRRTEFAYRLDDFDPGWIHTDADRRFAPYSNLEAGTYTFRVRAHTPRGEWSDDRELRIVVRPPPWKSWWAYLLYALSSTAALVGFVAHHRGKLARERAINRRLVESDRLKDEFLAQTSRELAARQRLLRERDTLIAALRERQQELERFHYAIAHDLKNPLVTIKTFLGVLRHNLAHGRDERSLGDLRHIDDAAEQLRDLFDGLGELSKIPHVGAEAAEVTTGEVELLEVADEAIRRQAGAIEAIGAEIRVAPQLPRVRGDRELLLDLLSYLLENAVKFMGETASPRIEIGYRPGEVDVFYVRDNGRGIEAPYQNKVFGLFERLDPAVPGIGMGLTLVRKIVEAHGGEVWIESEGRGLGSTVCWTLGPKSLVD